MVTELNDTASRTASQIITPDANGLSSTWKAPALPPKWIWLNAISIEAMAASAAVRLIKETARILPTRTWPRGTGVRSRLSSVLRSGGRVERSRQAAGQAHRDQDVGQEEAEKRVAGRLDRRAQRVLLQGQRIEHRRGIDSLLLQRGRDPRRVVLAEHLLQSHVGDLCALPRGVVVLLDA